MGTGTGRCGTVGVSEPPAGGDTGHATREVVGGLGQADRGHAGREAGWGGQFDQGDVVADGQHVELGVLEDLEQAAPLPAPAPSAGAPGTGDSTGTKGDPRDQWGPGEWPCGSQTPSGGVPGVQIPSPGAQGQQGRGRDSRGPQGAEPKSCTERDPGSRSQLGDRWMAGTPQGHQRQTGTSTGSRPQTLG